METWWVVLLSCAAQLWLRKAAAAAGAEFLVGVGKADMTGPIAEVGMMGYAQPSQTAGGLHLRLFARAFVAASEHAPEKRICFVSMDAGMPSQAQKIALVRKLAAKWPDGRYSARNVMISGTHTHSGPSGFFQYMLFDLAGSLHVNATASAFVDGVYDAIVAADSDLAPASISAARSEVNGANINRSPSSYLRNPAAERSRYKADTDRQLVQLLFTREIAADSAGDERNGISTPFALFNWFAVHPTSMNFTNHLISGDHKGTASQFIEQSMAKAVDESALPGHERSFVAAFASTNLGDVSPNTAGPICKAGPQIGQPCQLNKSTCAMPDGEPAAATYCWSLGPGRDMFESTQIIARKQAQVAEALLANTSAQSPLAGPISFAHSFVNMSEFELPTGERTCPPGLGYSFAGGTTDGPGDAPFYQGYDRPELPELWLAVRDALAEVLCSRPPTKVEYACHAPKPVLLPTGWMDRPWKWHPDIVDVQLFRIGNFVIAGVPGEFTTMSGRRLREALEISLRKQGVEEAQVVVAGLTNLYTQYIATPEEYQAQRYEAASTIYGPNTLPAYISAFEGLVPHLVNGTLAPPGPDPPDLINRQWEGLSAPGVDKVLEGHRIGDVLIQPKASYFTGRGHHDTVINATFLGVSAHDLMAHKV
eukprot:SAG31_NODE_6_length_43291_cov_191.503496_4_plen_652_part_00